MSENQRTCTICGTGGEAMNPLVQDEFYDDVRIHLHCLNGPAGRAWQAERAAADPRYARYQTLITVARPVECPSCGVPNRISPKAFGMGAGHWEATCTSCHRHATIIDGYRSAEEGALLRRLQALAHHFRLGRELDSVEAELDAIVSEADRASLPRPCECGGSHRLEARPRCRHCAGVLLDSAFHVTLTSSA